MIENDRIAIEMAGAGSAEQVLYRCLSKGLSFKVSSGTVLTLMPPLTSSADELDLAIEILGAAIAAAEEGFGK